MRKILNIMFGVVLMTTIIIFIGCEGKSLDDGSDYLADNPYESLDHIELTGDYELRITPSAVTMSLGASFQLYVTGGQEPYGRWMGGSVSESGLYTATFEGADEVSITDATGKTVSMTVKINSETKDSSTSTYDLRIIPDMITISQNESFQLQVTGGLEPYGNWIVTPSDLGSVTSSGIYTAGSKSGSNTVSITDATGETISMTVIVQ